MIGVLIGVLFLLLCLFSSLPPSPVFVSVAAFHLHFDDEPLHPNIAAWRTHRLPISKSKRHGDRGVVLDFWHLLTESIAAKNQNKRLNI